MPRRVRDAGCHAEEGLQYLRGVDERLRASGIISGDSLGASPWQGSFDAQTTAEPFTGWSIALWAVPPIDGGLAANRIRRTALGMSQLSSATISPTLAIKKPAHDIRFDWFVATGDSLRDRTILEMVKAEALKF